MDPGIQLTELLAYTADETSRWKRWFADHPAALDLPCDVAGAGTVRNLVKHIFLTELVFANYSVGLPRPDFEKLPIATVDELFAINEEAHGSSARRLPRRAQRAGPNDCPWGSAI